jgi:hypothetical protein
MGRVCFVCISPNRTEYDEMRINGRSIKDITAYARDVKGESNLEYHHFQKHLTNHVQVLVNESVKASRLRDQVVKEVIKKDIEIIKTFSNNLENVTKKVEIISKEMDSLENIERHGKMFLDFAGESRMIIEQFLKWGSKLNVQDTSSDTFNTIIKCMFDFPPELLAKFAERWKKANEPND